MVACAIGVLLIVAGLGLVRSVLHGFGIAAERAREIAALGALSDRLTAEEDDAWAIFVPPADVLGTSNADGHEIDFFTRDGGGTNVFWAYRFDASSGSVQRYTYATPGGTAAASGDPVTGVTSFHAATYPVTALQDASSPIYSPLYAGAKLQPGVVTFFPAQPWIAGGNAIGTVAFAGAHESASLELATGTAPSGFTLVFTYTPKPSPSPTSAPLRVSPATIVFTSSSVAVADTAAVRDRGIARALNALLGGAQALAATGCPAYAETAAGSIDANDPNLGTDAYGCMNGPYGVNLYATDAGLGAGTYGFDKYTCNTIYYYQWANGGSGPSATLPIGTTAPPASCQVIVGDTNHPIDTKSSNLFDKGAQGVTINFLCAEDALNICAVYVSQARMSASCTLQPTKYPYKTVTTYDVYRRVSKIGYYTYTQDPIVDQSNPRICTVMEYYTDDGNTREAPSQYFSDPNLP